MADFSKDIIKELKESNKRLEALERQGKEDDSPRSIIAQAVPEVLAAHRYPRVFQEKQGLYDVDDILKKQGGVHKDLIKNLQKKQVDTGEVMLNQNQKLLETLKTGFSKLVVVEQMLWKDSKFKVDNERFKQDYENTLLQTESLQEMKENLERFGGVATDNKKYNKESLKLQKAELDLRYDQATSPSAKKEIKEEQKALDKKNAGMLGIMAKALSGMWNKTKEVAKKVGGGLLTMLKGLAFAGFLVGILAFLDSETWEKWKQAIADFDFEALWDKKIKPIWDWFVGKFTTFWTNLEKFIINPGWDTLATTVPSLAPIIRGLGLIGEKIDDEWTEENVLAQLALPAVALALGVNPITTTIAMALSDGLKGYFKADEWGVSGMNAIISSAFSSVDGGLKGAMWGSAKYAIAGAAIGSTFPVIGTAIGGAIGAMLGGIIGYIGGERVSQTVRDTITFISSTWDNIFTGINGVFIDLLMGIDKIIKLGPWFDSIREMELHRQDDINKIESSNGVDQNILNFPTPEMFLPASTSGAPLQTAVWAEIPKTGFVVSKSDASKIVSAPPPWLPPKAGEGLATGGSFFANHPIIVGELGPEMILPNRGGHVMNAQRTAQIQTAGLQRGAMGQGAGPSIINAPVTSVNNSQSNMTLTSTSLKHPSSLLASVNVAA